MLEVTEVTPISLGYLTLEFLIGIEQFSMISLLVKEKLYIGEVVLGTAFGVVIGPHCANIFDPRAWGSSISAQNTITLEIMRVVLATGLFAIGVELPKAYLAEHAKSLLIMVVPTMAFGWVISAVLIHFLFPTLSFISALAISACLTPTDPILAAAIIGGKFAIKNVPGHIRRVLSAESAANDGLAYPFLSISIYLTVESSRRVAVGKWFLVGWLYQVILGTVLGAVMGLAFSYLMKTAHRRGLIDRESFVAQYLALAIFTIGVASTIGTDDLLAAFAAGSAISWDGHFNTHTEDEVFSSVIDLVLNCACFIYIGAWLPFDQFNSPTLGIEPWRLVVLFLAILVLRRIPSLLLLYKLIPDIHNWREALFCGHFGPMGVGAIFISTLALTRLPVPHNPPADQVEFLAASLHPIVSFVVLCSILIHGLSIPAFWFGRKVHSRTVSLSATWSRTWTSRTHGDHAPDWLLSARRAAPGILPSLPSPSPSSPVSPRTPGELESGGPEKQVGANEVLGSGKTGDGKATLRTARSLKSRPGTPHADSRVGSVVAFAPDVEGTSMSVVTPRSETFKRTDAEAQESVMGRDSRAGSRAWTKSPMLKGDGESSEEHHVHVHGGNGDGDEIVGYGFASLHDERENDASQVREREAATREREGNERNECSADPAPVMKQVQFVQ